MSQKVLITYASKAGSTAEIAELLAQVLHEKGDQVHIRPVALATDISGFDAVIVGGPMILGWHRAAVKFLKKHRHELSKIPVAYFITSLELTRTNSPEVGGVPIFIDPNYPTLHERGKPFSPKELHTTEAAYLMPILDAAPEIKPTSVAFFRGSLDYHKLNLFAKLFVKLVIHGREGDYRNWEAIRTWAARLPNVLEGQAVAR